MKKITAVFAFFLSALTIDSIAQSDITSSTFGALEARVLGPGTMSGRISAIEGVNTENGKTIYEFEQGDIITRVKPAILGTNDFAEPEPKEDGVLVLAKIKDFSYRGDRLKYLGIANNMIYLEHVDGILKGETTDLDIERWSDGWDIWVNPKEMFK